MHKVGISFRSTKTPDEVREQYVKPLRAALKTSGAGIYTNYLRQADPDAVEPTEHLLVFEIHDFKDGLRVLRVAWQELAATEEAQFHNLDPSSPGY